MNKQYILNEIKNEMKTSIDYITGYNLYERRSRLGKLFDLLELLYEVDSEGEVEEPEGGVDSYDGEEYYEGRVHLKLGGGTLGEERVFIPEKVLRLQNISEGDEVRATVVKRVYNNNHLKNIYSYELLNKATEHIESERRVISYARVAFDYNDDTLYLEGDGDDGHLRVDLEDMSFGNLTVSEGDIVDYAYWQRDPEGGRVIWIHNIDGDNVLTSYDNTANVEAEDPSRFLSHVQLAVFGGGDIVERHVDAMMDAGSDVIHISDVNRHNIESNLNGVDLVLVYLDSVRPAEVKAIRDGVRKRDLDVLFIQDDDLDNIFAAIQDKLENSYYFNM